MDQAAGGPTQVENFMSDNTKRGQKGFSLAELMVALTRLMGRR